MHTHTKGNIMHTDVADKTKTDGWAVISDFLTTIYGDKADQVWVNGFADVSSANWFGMRGLDALKSRLVSVDSADLYFSVGLLSDDSGRKSNNVFSQPVLYADDIGSKGSRSAWDLLFMCGFPEPTFRIETSPDNESWIWKLSGDPTTEERRVDLHAIRAHLTAREGAVQLTDPIKDEARYMRLPWGHNSKEKYRKADGSSPSVRIVGGTRKEADIDAVGRALLGRKDWRSADLPVGAEACASVVGSSENSATMNDPYVRLAEAVGMDPKPHPSRPNTIRALCPNFDNHTDVNDLSGFDFLSADGHCKCQHAGCSHINTPEFMRMMIEKYDRENNTPASASAFLAQIVFGTDNAEGQAQLEAEVDRAAASQAAGEADIEDGLRSLVERFVWVQFLDQFYDTVDRKFIKKQGIAMHPAVTKFIRAGGSGPKAAHNVLANRADLRLANGVTYAPGKSAAIVDAEDENGQIVPCVNTWEPSKYSAVAGEPLTWLRVVHHVLHEKDYREWFLNWLAYIVQNPATCVPTIPLIVSGQGVGKDTMLLPVQRFLGKKNCGVVNSAQIMGQFNEFLCRRLLVLQETKFDGGGQAYNRIKDWTGDQTGWVEINAKFMNPYSIKFAGVFIAFSNDEGAIKGIDPDDRRFGPFITDADKLETIGFNHSDHKNLADRNEIGRVRHFLENRDLSNFSPFYLPADTSGSKARTVYASLKPSEQITHDVVSSGALADRQIFSLAEALDATVNEARLRGVNTNHISNATVKRGMEAAGLMHLRPRGSVQIRVDGLNVRLWSGKAAEPWICDLDNLRLSSAVRYSEAYRDDKKRAEGKHLSVVQPQ